MLLGCNNNWLISDNDQLSETLLRVIFYYHYECDGCNCLNYENKVRTWGVFNWGLPDFTCVAKLKLMYGTHKWMIDFLKQ